MELTDATKLVERLKLQNVERGQDGLSVDQLKDYLEKDGGYSGPFFGNWSSN